MMSIGDPGNRAHAQLVINSLKPWVLLSPVFTQLDQQTLGAHLHGSADS